MIDQTALGQLVTALMERIETQQEDNEAELGDMVLVVEVMTSEASTIMVQSNQLRTHALAGLLAMGEGMVIRNSLE